MPSISTNRRLPWSNPNPSHHTKFAMEVRVQTKSGRMSNRPNRGRAHEKLRQEIQAIAAGYRLYGTRGVASDGRSHQVQGSRVNGCIVDLLIPIPPMPRQTIRPGQTVLLAQAALPYPRINNHDRSRTDLSAPMKFICDLSAERCNLGEIYRNCRDDDEIVLQVPEPHKW